MERSVPKSLPSMDVFIHHRYKAAGQILPSSASFSTSATATSTGLPHMDTFVPLVKHTSFLSTTSSPISSTIQPGTQTKNFNNYIHNLVTTGECINDLGKIIDATTTETTMPMTNGDSMVNMNDNPQNLDNFDNTASFLDMLNLQSLVAPMEQNDIIPDQKRGDVCREEQWLNMQNAVYQYHSSPSAFSRSAGNSDFRQGSSSSSDSNSPNDFTEVDGGQSDELPQSDASDTLEDLSYGGSLGSGQDDVMSTGGFPSWSFNYTEGTYPTHVIDAAALVSSSDNNSWGDLSAFGYKFSHRDQSEALSGVSVTEKSGHPPDGQPFQSHPGHLDALCSFTSQDDVWQKTSNYENMPVSTVPYTGQQLYELKEKVPKVATSNVRPFDAMRIDHIPEVAIEAGHSEFEESSVEHTQSTQPPGDQYVGDKILDTAGDDEEVADVMSGKLLEGGHRRKARTNDLSYMALISKAILNSPDKKLLLCDIYKYISEHSPGIQSNQKAWRNSIRHNLSLNECFVKQVRSGKGRGHYWTIHPACVEDFTKGIFKRRLARRRARTRTADVGGASSNGVQAGHMALREAVPEEGVAHDIAVNSGNYLPNFMCGNLNASFGTMKIGELPREDIRYDEGSQYIGGNGWTQNGTALQGDWQHHIGHADKHCNGEMIFGYNGNHPVSAFM